MVAVLSPDAFPQRGQLLAADEEIRVVYQDHAVVQPNASFIVPREDIPRAPPVCGRASCFPPDARNPLSHNNPINQQSVDSTLSGGPARRRPACAHRSCGAAAFRPPTAVARPPAPPLSGGIP